MDFYFTFVKNNCALGVGSTHHNLSLIAFTHFGSSRTNDVSGKIVGIAKKLAFGAPFSRVKDESDA